MLLLNRNRNREEPLREYETEEKGNREDMENPKQEAKGQGTEIAEQDRQRNLELQERLEKSPHAKSAMKNFRDGYNCCQSVVLAFSEEIGLDEKTMLRLASPFGGGMGRLRECAGQSPGCLWCWAALWI